MIKPAHVKTLLLLLPITVHAFSLKAQNDFKKNDVYLEAGGSGFFGSINYERQLTNKPGLGLRWGVGFYTDQAYYLAIPIGFNYLFPLRNKHSFMEVGLGTTWSTDETFIDEKQTWEKKTLGTFIPSLAYRRHTKHSLMWRIAATPLINKFGVYPWLGFSLGKRF
jgi:hypothetical protein